MTTRGVLHPEAIGTVFSLERRLQGAGWAVGTKFLPAGVEPFVAPRMRELTDRVLGLREAFDDAGARLERACPPQLAPR